jgi:antitoxin component YwqK of YwqJK toxin-antitoxin module
MCKLKYAILISLLLLTDCKNENRAHSALSNGGILDTVRTFDDQGRVTSVTPFKNGKKDGMYIGYYSNKDTFSIAFYKDGELRDSALQFYPNKQISSILYFDSLGRCIPLAKLFYDNGGLKQYVNMDGSETIFFYRDGAIQLKSYYQNRRKNGKWIYYTPDGAVLKTEKYENDSLVDYPLITDTSIKVRMNGWLRIYNKNKALISESFYKKGIKSGASINYYEDGSIKEISFYKKNLLNGKQMIFNWNDGQIKSQNIYKMGRLIKE